MTAGNAILIVAIVTGLGLIGALFFVMFKIRQISREFFGTSSLIEGLKRQEALEDDTPKSVSGMTRVSAAFRVGDHVALVISHGGNRGGSRKKSHGAILFRCGKFTLHPVKIRHGAPKVFRWDFQTERVVGF